MGEMGGRMGKELQEWGADSMDSPEFDYGREVPGAI